MSQPETDPIIEEFVAGILAARKYSYACEDTVRDVITKALPRYKRAKDAIKAARAKLHQIHAAYSGPNAISQNVEAIRSAHAAGDREALKRICRRLMEDHVSTRERILHLDDFYPRIFRVTGTPKTILDVACGMHPLGIPWMDLPPGALYHAYDIASDLVRSVNEFLAAIGFAPKAVLRDVLCRPPEETGDLAFLMKAVPCLEQRERGAAVQVIDSLRVRHVVVTFPLRSLSGRPKNMRLTYTKAFSDMTRGRPWRVTPIPMEAELVFIVEKGYYTSSTIR